MARPTKFEIKDGRSGSEATVSISGELDLSTAQTLSQHVDQHLSAGVTDLTLDLGDVEFMDSTGLRLLIELNDRCQDQAWRLTLKRPRHSDAAHVLEATGADTALPFVSGMDQ